MKTIVIGAGLTGLVVARKLMNLNTSSDSVTVLEKSRGVGGRMATRRSDHAKFDHGAQFYRLREAIMPYHDQWKANGLLHQWFNQHDLKHFNAPAGLTALAKDLAQGLDVRFEQKIESCESVSGGWRLKMDGHEDVDAERVVLTAPLPQALDLLEKSGLAYDSALKKITYSKAIVALIEVQDTLTSFGGQSGYQEFKDGPLFSIADQFAKQVSQTPAYTVTLGAELSEALFDLADGDIEARVGTEIRRQCPDLVVTKIQIKKWRYNQPRSHYDQPYVEVCPNLFLAGDAFGGASLNGAVRSAEALAKRLSVEI